MRIHSISTICRKCLMLLALLLASIQMVHAQEAGGTTTTETKVYGEPDLIAKDYAGGSGTKNDPWLISNDLQLAKLAHDVNNGTTKAMFAGKYFRLTQDIDLSQGKWMPIGTWKCNKKDNDRYFAGKFDGDGHTISNMKIEWINATGFEASWGLFGRLYGTPKNTKDPKPEEYATVTNLVIENALIEKKKGYIPQGKSVIKIGIVASDLTQYAEISNIIIRKSNITDNDEKYASESNYRVGGIVGYIDNGGNFRIFNISADTELNMHKDNTSFRGQMTIAGGFGFSSIYGTHTTAILPTHLYFHGPQIQPPKTSSNKIFRGSLFVFNDKTNNPK